jgi:hypothetical protein
MEKLHDLHKILANYLEKKKFLAEKSERGHCNQVAKLTTSVMGPTEIRLLLGVQ